jgi:DNA-binding IscR family transcriptional regulator
VSELPRRQFCSEEPHCSLRDIWLEVREAISKVVDQTTFADLCERIQAKRERLAITYHI